MKAMVQDQYGTAEVLHLRDIAKPEVGQQEVLIRVVAAAVNPGDWAIMNGLPYIARPFPLYGMRRPKHGVRGTDVAGIVESVGAGVTRFQPATRSSDGARDLSPTSRWPRRTRSRSSRPTSRSIRQPLSRCPGPSRSRRFAITARSRRGNGF